MKNLRLEGAFDDGRLTVKDVELFASQGCGACELAKMRRRAFTIKVQPDDPTPPTLGKMWTFDVLELRVPSAHTGATFLYAAVEKVSKKIFGGHMRGYSETDVTDAQNELRARVRPRHGEIWIVRMDSHPSHRSKHVRNYMLNAQQRLQLSPPYVHEGVGDPENFFLHYVPAANSMIVASPDLGEEHFAQSLMYAMVAKDHCVAANSSPPRSPAMLYYESDRFLSSHLMVFGSEGKALVHGEARDSKFDDHAKPCIYMGPAVDSDSRAHCAVWFGSTYVDVDIGCTAFNEDTVIDRTRRDHPCTQPFNQVAGRAAIDVGKPTAIFDLVGDEGADDELPLVQPVVWVRSMVTPSSSFAVLIWHGGLRAGDMASWTHELSAHKLIPFPIDLFIGGQEHNSSRAPIKKALLELSGDEHCTGTFMSPRCSPFTAARFNQPGPPVLFDTDNRDGIPDDDGEFDSETLIALSDVRFVCDIFRTSVGNDKVIMLEFPASQAIGSPFAAKGREKHSTIADTSMMRTLKDELCLELIFTEQGAAGAESRKPTSILTTANGAHSLRRTVGTLYKPDGAYESILGKACDGSYNTLASQTYTSHFSMLLTIAFVGSMERIVGVVSDAVSMDTDEPATDDLFPIGTRVEVWWYLDKQWYAGVVLDSKVRKGKVHGKSISRREIMVRYDSDDQRLWHALCSNSVREAKNEENDASLTVLGLLANRLIHPDAESSDANDSAGWFNVLDAGIASKLSATELASRIAYHRMASLRACTSFAQPLDESTSCNGTQREDIYRSRLLVLSYNESVANTLIEDSFRLLKSQYTTDEWQRMACEREAWLKYVKANETCRGADVELSSSEQHELGLALREHVGQIFVMRRLHLDLEDGFAHDACRMLVVLDDSTVEDVDYSGAHGWHVPRNEREYLQSPQRDLWRTAKELKMDDYLNVGMYELVPESSVDKSKYKIYDTIWVHKIEWKDGGLIFNKLKPRWCVKGGSMDPDLYKSYAEMMRPTSMAIMWGLKTAFYDKLTDALLDLKDAFQATATVDATGALLPGQKELYTYQAPGFAKWGPSGERLVCRQKCYMQGRIDSTNGFDHRVTSILTKSAHFKSMLWDAKVFLFHNTKYSGTATPLDTIIDEAHAIVVEDRDSEPQQTPRGWAMLGQHVDDMQFLTTGLQGLDNRILQFVKGEISVTYACKLTRWHGNKMLGFDLELNNILRTVHVSAQATYAALRSRLIASDTVKITPKHIVTEAVYESSPGEQHELGDPARAAFLERQSLTRSVLGGGIWLSQAYPQIASGINSMCVNMANPSDARLAQLRHMFMFLGDTPRGKTFGGVDVSSIMHTATEIKPFTSGMKAGYYHYFSDASINVTGGVAMFAGGCIGMVCLRQHLKSPEAHTSELVAGGTNINQLIPVNGLLQEIGIRMGLPTHMYFDSKSTVFVASSDAAPKKSVWLTRRNKVITEAVEYGEMRPIHLCEADMVADSNTKYVKHITWSRHMHYILNLPGDPPPRPTSSK